MKSIISGFIQKKMFMQNISSDVCNARFQSLSVQKSRAILVKFCSPVLTRQMGFGYVEYMVSTLAVLFMLFAPLPGQGGETVVDVVMSAIRAFGQNSSLLLSLP